MNPDDTPQPGALPRVRQIADQYMEVLADLDPRAAGALGRSDGVRIPDLTPDAFAERNELDRRTLQVLQDTSPASEEGQRLRAVMRERLSSDVALYDAGFTTRLLAPLATPVHGVRTVFDNLPRESRADWERVCEHLHLVPSALAGYEQTLAGAARQGHVVARRQIETMAVQCEEWTDPSGADFFGQLVGSGDAPSSLRESLDAGARAAGDAVRAFARWLRTELLPLAPEADGVGRELYSVTATAFLGSAVDLDDVYAYGWRELARLYRELEATAVTITPEGLAAAVGLLDGDVSRQVRTGEPLVAWLQERVEATTEALDGRHFDIPSVTRAVECQTAPATSGVMYYTAPDPQLTRPGRVWWTTPPGARSVGTWRQVTNLHHEGLPGHHLQHAITMADEGLHPWQRLICQVHGYAEGWAHYSEGLADELGLLRDPGERMGMLLGQLWRAARIVIDIGLHLDLPIPEGNGFTSASRWTVPVARDFLTSVAGIDPHTARFEVDRYLGWPGQALSFSVGARLWREARQEAEQRLGPAFDLKEFHMQALGLGPMGLGPLARFVRPR